MKPGDSVLLLKDGSPLTPAKITYVGEERILVKWKSVYYNPNPGGVNPFPEYSAWVKREEVIQDNTPYSILISTPSW